MLRVITANVNGIRSAAKKGFFSWLTTQHADVICLQETRCDTQALDSNLFFPAHYHHAYCDAHKKGYSGVSIYSKRKPLQITKGLGWAEADTEGRYIEADFGDLAIASLYMPSGTSGDARQAVKFDFMQRYETQLKEQCQGSKAIILCGDWNIAHKPIDLKNWRANQNTSGFLPEERAWLDTLVDTIGWVDAFRVVNQNPEQYTWWSQRSPTARSNNVGWRIDYQFIHPLLKDKVLAATICATPVFSDHAPVIIDYNLGD
jgi:exodeoxyribonuclease-3